MAFLLQHRVKKLKKNWVFENKISVFWEFGNKNSVFSQFFCLPIGPKPSRWSQNGWERTKKQKLSFCQPEDIHCRSHLQNRLSDRVWEVILVNISRNLLLNGFQPWMERVENNHTNHDRKIKAVDWCRCSTQLKDRTLFCVSWAILTQSKPLFDSMFCNSVNVT